MKISDKIKNYIRNWLNVRESISSRTFDIQEMRDFRLQAYLNDMWYRGDSDELHQFYTQIEDATGRTAFWQASNSHSAIKIRKIHTGIPAIIVDRLVDITVDDINEIQFPETNDYKMTWDKIAQDNKFIELLKKACTKMLVAGDGAFKLSYDPNLSALPIIEFFGGEDVEFETRKGRVIGVRFYTKHIVKDKVVVLEEYYSLGRINYTIYDTSGQNVTDTYLQYFNDLQDISLSNDDRILFAVPMIFGTSKQWEGRGRSIFTGKHQAFDSIDEIFSTWMDEIRAGRSKTYIPETLIPRNEETGELIKPDPFQNRYIKVATDNREGAKNEITTQQPDIKVENLIQSYVTALDICLQGIISPATLGIDVKKLDNAESQREKEKATMFTRNKLVGVLQEVIPQLIDTTLKFNAIINNLPYKNYDSTITFGEYADPTFESQIETIGKARQLGIMSIDKCIDELYGDTLNAKLKSEEVKRIKNEHSIDETLIVKEDDLVG